MAYAVLSSLPPIYGLYASTIAGYVLHFPFKKTAFPSLPPYPSLPPFPIFMCSARLFTFPPLPFSFP